ncbi:hypothetical protein D7243_06420 [Stutzerimonas stutzeri]|nr:hypothetical protein [Stutzerimonas stutzeri]
MDESSCYRPRVIPAGKAGCLLEKPLKINRFGVITGAVARKGKAEMLEPPADAFALSFPHQPRCAAPGRKSADWPPMPGAHDSCDPTQERPDQRPDLILVQLRVIARWVLGSRSGKV